MRSRTTAAATLVATLALAGCTSGEATDPQPTGTDTAAPAAAGASTQDSAPTERVTDAPQYNPTEDTREPVAISAEGHEPPQPMDVFTPEDANTLFADLGLDETFQDEEGDRLVFDGAEGANVDVWLTPSEDNDAAVYVAAWKRGVDGLDFYEKATQITSDQEIDRMVFDPNMPNYDVVSYQAGNIMSVHVDIGGFYVRVDAKTASGAEHSDDTAVVPPPVWVQKIVPMIEANLVEYVNA